MADEKGAKPEKAKPKSGQRPDLVSIGGLVVALGGILAGLIMDGGKMKDIQQFSAALIVVGGTLGAVMITTPMPVLMRAAGRIGAVFFEKTYTPASVIEEIVGYASQARKQGIVSLEQQANNIQDPFLQKALNLAIDGVEMNQLRGIMELEITLLEQRGEAEAKVFESAGGYSPTIGIIGAVLGLMQVMKNLANIDEVGRGIATAFVATVYGVALANIFLLPAAAKLKARVKEEVRIRELALEGVLSVVEGMNPKLIKTKLEAYAPPKPNAEKKAKAKAALGKPAPAEG
ncbi:MAG: flagellar motor protein [Acidobacteriia bacterium]|nr:flagellar motor protein [Terriglobia bacterium]